MRRHANAYNRGEVAGAFGDLGTLTPFLVGYVTIAQVDPTGMLIAFGVFKIVAGLTYKTPMPIQPMKAIGTPPSTARAPSLPAPSGRLVSSPARCGSSWGSPAR
jgi:hypothetical protein